MIRTVRGVLLDVDGTLLEGDRAIPGAAEAVARIRAARWGLRVTTNTTRRPRRAIAAALDAAGIRVEAREILTPAVLARTRITASGRVRAALLVPNSSKEDFEGVEEDPFCPEWVVLGDLGSEFTFERMNRAFGWLREGATLLALQRNRSWDPGDGRLVLDAGAYVAALEYAAGVVAEVVGKPSREFFDLAVTELGLDPDQVLVVGDDHENDCQGGRAAGCRTALVRTGKGRQAPVAAADLVLDSVADLVP